MKGAAKVDKTQKVGITLLVKRTYKARGGIPKNLRLINDSRDHFRSFCTCSR